MFCFQMILMIVYFWISCMMPISANKQYLKLSSPRPMNVKNNATQWASSVYIQRAVFINSNKDGTIMWLDMKKYSIMPFYLLIS